MTIELSNGRGFEIPYEDIRLVAGIGHKLPAFEKDHDLIVVRGLGRVKIPNSFNYDRRRITDRLYLFQILKHCVKQSQYIDFETIPKHATV